MRARRAKERRRREGERARSPCVRVSERVWRAREKKKKKKGSEGELAAFCPSHRAAALLLFMWTLVATATRPRGTEAASAGDPRPTD